MVAAGYANYLVPLTVPDGVTFKGQALIIVIPFAIFPVTIVLWWLYRFEGRRSRWFTWFGVAMMAAWAIHMVLIEVHGDLYPLVVWLFIPTLAMVLVKPPSADDAWRLLQLLGWSAAIIVVATRVLEMIGAIPIFHIPDDVLAWERGRYWLPISGLFGLDYRWPGPFGYNSKTGFVCALLVILAFARWSRSSIPFLVVGVLGILLTGARGSMLALVCGLGVLAIFSRWGPLARVPAYVRSAVGITAFAAVALLFLTDRNGTTGRMGPKGIWTAFVAEWQTSIWIGVGQSGLDLAGGRIALAMEAASLYIQELTKFGIVGFVTQFAALGIGIAVASIAAYRGLAGPLALMAAFFVASVTELFTDGWQNHSIYSILIVLSVAWASAWLIERRPALAADSEQRPDGLTLESTQQVVGDQPL